MFDRTEIVVRAGDGGNGVVSFRREKFVPFGGPDGGDGGDGGDVVIVADSGVSDLRIFEHKRFYRAADGKSGKGKKKHGKKGENLILMVPVGTVVSDETRISGDTGIADLEQHGQQVMVVKGGKGGLYSFCFVYQSSATDCPAGRGGGRASHNTGAEAYCRCWHYRLS